MRGRKHMPALITAGALVLGGSAVAQAVIPDLGALTGALGLSGPAPEAGGSAAAAGYSAAASGVVLHAGAAAGLLSTDLARSAAGVAEAGANAVTGDLGREEVPALAVHGSYGRGAGLVSGIGGGGVSPSSSGGATGAEATAPPSSGVVRHEATPLDLAGLVSGGLLRAEAQARSPRLGCVVGEDLSTARGEAGDFHVAGVATMVAPSGVPLSHSVSRTVIVPGGAGRLALRSETRQRLSPITFLAGTPAQFSVHTEGEWVLRAEADGESGTVSFGPADGGEAGTGRAVRVVDASGRVLAEGAPATGTAGIRLQLPGLVEVVVGEAPRAPGGDDPALSGGQRVAAAADLVRVRVLGQELRVGHMEAAVSVPASGVHCPAATATLVLPAGPVDPGAEFPVAVRIANPNDGSLSVPALTARVAAAGVSFEALPEDGAQVAAGTLAWPALTVPAGETVERRARIRIAPGSAPGAFAFAVNADGAYGPAADSPPGSGVVVPVPLRADAQGPAVNAFPAVPEVVGRRVVEARAVLEAAGFGVAVEEGAPGGAADVVIGQRPSGRAAPGSLVTLVVPRAAPRAAASPPPTSPPSAPTPPPPAAAAAPPAPPAAPAAVALPAAAAQETAETPSPTAPAAEAAAPAGPGPRPQPVERAPKPVPPPGPGGDDDGSRWLWGLVALALIGVVATAASRSRG